MMPGVERKSIAFKKLKKLYREKQGRQAPQYNDSNATGLTRCIVDYLNLKGYQAERIHCMGAPIPMGDGTYRMGKTTMDKGTADISATIYGLSVKIEVKGPGDKMSPLQYEYKEKIERAGGVYYVAKSFDAFLIWFNENLLKGEWKRGLERSHF